MAAYNTNVPYTGDGDTSSGSASATFGTDFLKVAHATYDFNVDGGAISTITPATNATIPQGAIILGGVAKVVTAFVGTSGTVAIGLSAGGGTTTSLLGATAVASLTANSLFVLSGGVAPINLTANAKITVTIATTAMTAGRMEIFPEYVVSPA